MHENDHRAIANRMDLFHQQEEAAGMVFWHPRGFALYRIIEDYLRRRMRRAGFREIRTPQLLSRVLWERSGHWDKFADAIFALDHEHGALALKPMSCPAHVQIFNQRQRSFRDLPLRYCEFGVCHRDEPSGALHGLLRTRAFVQDDAHIFCTPDQVKAEVARFGRLLLSIYGDFGFDPPRIAFSTRPAQRAGDEAEWDQAEAQLGAAARSAGLDFIVDPGAGAFYGPKLDFHLRDAQGREWQCGTIQLDLVQPARLRAHYTDAGGAQRRPVMLHHAVLGSLERFIGMLLEHYSGALPLWLAPDQIVIASVGAEHHDYAERVAADFAGADYRVMTDLRPERLGRKVVDAHHAGTPLVGVVGSAEAAEGTVALRWRDGRQETMPAAMAVECLRGEAFR